ncbi:MAG: polyphosphate kinase 1 [bacterium]|nr:polyphosphate kinase 1 [bacterium]
MNTMKKSSDSTRFIPKELSWLAFNQRVLQEAADPRVPLVERLRFLGIASNNLDEFFRVRVASLKRLARLGPRAVKLIGHDANHVLEQVRQRVIGHNREYDEVFRTVLERLEQAGIRLAYPAALDERQAAHVRDHFRRHVRAELSPVLLGRRERLADLNERNVYLAVRLSDSQDRRRERHALIDLPADLPRFLVLPVGGRRRDILLLDDMVRLMLGEIFAQFQLDRQEAWAFKLTRDAELDVEDDVGLSFSAKLAVSLKKRARGAPVRLLYDAAMPRELLDLLVAKLGISRRDTLLPGGRIHKRSDFLRFPDISGPRLQYPPALVTPHRGLPADASMLASLRRRDLLLHVPYNPFSQFVDLLREAALDPKVTAIRMTLYRVARASDVVRALVSARRNGKQVTVVVELQARFDEEANINWAEQLRDEGVEVIFGVPGLKVHAKLLLIERQEGREGGLYAGVGTGNFNEDTASIFEDMLLLTTDRRITREVAQLFAYFRRSYLQVHFQHLLVSPWTTRDRIDDLIKGEISRAAAGRPARIDLKLNNLADHRVIDRLYEAAAAGVELRLNVRGMFAMKPGWPKGGRPVQAMAVIDRYLEHSRVFRFHQQTRPLFYLGSGDLLPRNLDRRIEAMVPIYDPGIRAYLERVLDLHWEDRASARLLDDRQGNVRRDPAATRPRVQEEIARLNRELHGLGGEAV